MEGYFGFGTVMQLATVKPGCCVSDITHSFLMGLSLDLDLLSITTLVEPEDYQVWAMWWEAWPELRWKKQASTTTSVSESPVIQISPKTYFSLRLKVISMNKSLTLNPGA